MGVVEPIFVALAGIIAVTQLIIAVDLLRAAFFAGTATRVRSTDGSRYLLTAAGHAGQAVFAATAAGALLLGGDVDIAALAGFLVFTGLPLVLPRYFDARPPPATTR